MAVFLYDMPPLPAVDIFYDAFDGVGVADRATFALEPAERGLTCGACGLTFASVEEQRGHFRSADHSRMVGSGDAIWSSDSSSDSEAEAGGSTEAGSPLVHVRLGDRVFTTWKTHFPDDLELRRLRDGEVTSMPAVQHWLHRLAYSTRRPVAVLLLRSGRFAGAIFRAGLPARHKCFQRYTTRRKQGGAQSTRDGSGGRRPRSAGSWIRRHNEAALDAEVRALLGTEWAEELAACVSIFLGASKRNLSLFFGGEPPVFDRADARVRRVPLPFGRPTLVEVQRVHDTLMRVQVTAAGEEPGPAAADATAEYGAGSCSGVAAVEAEVGGAPVVEGAVEEALDETDAEESKAPAGAPAASGALGGAWRTWRARVAAALAEPEEDAGARLLELLAAAHPAAAKGESGSPGEGGPPEEALADALCAAVEEDAEGRTLLHIGSAGGAEGVVSALLGAGADPCVPDARGRLPYAVAASKAVRDEFRRFHGCWPGRYDFRKAGVPEPTDEQAARERRRERKRAQRLRQRRRQRGGGRDRSGREAGTDSDEEAAALEQALSMTRAQAGVGAGAGASVTSAPAGAAPDAATGSLLELQVAQRVAALAERLGVPEESLLVRLTAAGAASSVLVAVEAMEQALQAGMTASELLASFE